LLGTLISFAVFCGIFVWDSQRLSQQKQGLRFSASGLALS
jgi:hypothetical protein